MSKFAELREIDVSQYVEKKGKFTYLSWAWAVDQLLQQDEKATWQFREPTIYPDNTMMVWCDINAFGKTMTSYLPVMNNMNRAIKNPDAMAINTAMQRCLAKGIGLLGIGLYIYAGEDIPEGDPAEILWKTYETQGKEGATAYYKNLTEEERKHCEKVIEKIRKDSNGKDD